MLYFYYSMLTGFGLGGGTSSASSGFSFGGGAAVKTTAAPAASTGFSLGGTTPSSSTGFSLGGTAPPATSTAATPLAGFSLGGTTAATNAATGGGLGGFGTKLGGGSLTSGTPLGLGTSTAAATAAATSAAPGGFSFGGGAATTKPTAAVGGTASGFSLAGAATGAATTTASSGFALPSLGTATSTASKGFSLATSSATTTSSGLSLPTSSTASVGFGGLAAPAAASTQASLTSTTTTTSSAAATVQASNLSFRQLEENMNKWTLELEEMEKQFLNQSSQVNAWDQLLVKNGEKILSLNDTVSRVRQDQQRLEHELDFVAGQQTELEEALRPLEASISAGSGGPVDTERERTYQLSENLDAQLKRMSEDLKEVIAHLNLGNRGSDSADPVAQIAKILNAHMDSLQWIDSNAGNIEKQLAQVQRITQIQKRDSERLHRSFTD